MKKYRVKMELEIGIWNTPGDHPEVRFPAYSDDMGDCEHCNNKLIEHGFIDYEGMPKSPVCPGDYIVNGPAGPFAITEKFLDECYEEVSE